MKSPIIRVGAPCEPLLPARTPDPCLMTIVGATGDLARRKLVPALYNLARENLLPHIFGLIGFSRSVGPPGAYRTLLRQAVDRFSRVRPVDDHVWDRFAAMIDTVPGSFDEPQAMAALRARLDELDARIGARGNRLYYLATLPSAFPDIVTQLHQHGLLERGETGGAGPWQRLVVEKPFGRDLDSARQLNALLTELASEEQVFRIDHYLGKETVQNILVLRFGNSIFDPLWNRKYIDHVQVTAAEDFGIEGRGAFYDETGVLRDAVQNHLLEILALCAMEPPVSFAADAIRDEKVKLLRALRPISCHDVGRLTVRAQYRGYREEPGVPVESTTPTYAALKLWIDNWRWQGVPFYLRAGKRLARRTAEVSIHFQSVPSCLFGGEALCHLLDPNVLRIRIQPDEGIELSFSSKVPGEDLAIAPVTMDFSYARSFAKQPPEAYERLLLDCMRGDATLFSRRDAIEQAWQFITPVLTAWEQSACSSRLAFYEPGTEGPAEAERLIQQDGRRWRPLE